MGETAIVRSSGKSSPGEYYFKVERGGFILEPTKSRNILGERNNFGVPADETSEEEEMSPEKEFPKRKEKEKKKHHTEEIEILNESLLPVRIMSRVVESERVSLSKGGSLRSRATSERADL